MELIKNLSSWMASVSQLSADRQEDIALKEIVLKIMQFKVSEDYYKLSSDLVSFDLKNLPDVILVALVRNTFLIRSQLSCWNNLIDQIEQILVDRNRDPSRLLRGLKRYS